MPQVWNPSVATAQDAGGFNKGSRLMNLSNFSDASLRGIKVRNRLENNLSDIQKNYISRSNRHCSARIDHARKHIIERQKRFTAYRLVVQKKHPIRLRSSYDEALNDNYSMHALRHEVRRMLRDIDPNSVRRRKAESLIQQSRDQYKDTMTKNRAAIEDLIPKPKPVVVEEKEDTRSPTPPPAPKAMRRSIFGPPLRGLAHTAQPVTVKMVKEQSWMDTAPSPDKALAPKNLNPHAVLPSIQA
ncbi:uncharacterized protein [Littorina saxatilis]|uniref:Uncharacterized protein n=1 Tax=Littorina saxatilis TaxID=31220 RepID=A0AAN9BBG0_9CAEN